MSNEKWKINFSLFSYLTAHCPLSTAPCFLTPVFCILFPALPTNLRRTVLLTTFVVYIAVAAALTVVPTHLARVRTPRSDHINLTPFDYSYRCYRNAFGTYSDLKSFCIKNTLGNIVLFFPLGIMLPLISERLRTLKRVLVIALVLSLTIEATQFALRFVGNPRATDIDDVILNTLGGCLGFGFYKEFIADYVTRGLSRR